MIRHLGIVILLGACASASSGGAPLTVHGCYRFDQAYFTAAVQDSRGEYVGIESTRVVQLTLTLTRIPVGGDKAVQQPFTLRLPELNILPEEARSYAKQSHWAIIGADSIRVSWWNGLFGPSFRLVVRGDSLIGVQSFGSDIASGSTTRGDTVFIHFAEPVWEPATAVRVACPPRSPWRR
jgi:hypothetical protein